MLAVSIKGKQACKSTYDGDFRADDIPGISINPLTSVPWETYTRRTRIISLVKRKIFHSAQHTEVDPIWSSTAVACDVAGGLSDTGFMMSTSTIQKQPCPGGSSNEKSRVRSG
jgi:hypothetical protein